MAETELLSTTDLKYYGKLFQIPLIDVLSKDLFKNITPEIGGYIINLEDHIYSGSHWTTLILTKDIAIYYDSFGGPIPQDILQFIKKFNKKSTIIYSIDVIQYKNSIYCGWFCIYQLFFMLVKHKNETNYKYLLNKHNAIFSLKDTKSNDDVLKQLIKTITDKIKI